MRAGRRGSARWAPARTLQSGHPAVASALTVGVTLPCPPHPSHLHAKSRGQHSLSSHPIPSPQAGAGTTRARGSAPGSQDTGKGSAIKWGRQARTGAGRRLPHPSLELSHCPPLPRLGRLSSSFLRPPEPSRIRRS